MISDLKSKGVNVGAIVTDSASAYTAARQRLRISNRTIVFLLCFAHQINLCVGEIFKESTELKVALNNAIRLTTYFRNPNHKFFVAKLHEHKKSLMMNDYVNIQLATQIQVQLEKRWKQFKNNVNINYTTFGKWQKKSTCILCEFDNFHLDKYPFNDDTYGSSKVLNMSKLRADITWKHHINSDSSILTSLSIIITCNEEENNNEKEVEENLVIIKEEEEEEEDLEKKFNNYLQGWSEMLEEETYEFEENENENDIMHITVDDILHPAIDPNAKWNLNSFFKELEFLF
ncbi:hypothetical protein RhiirA1_477901 [Rhizophagus irregularis]|uniref:DUF659 domain-containing protein n=2 Tax=Rhizophagus irregularis TaxID=588596 RepID=A0A2N0QSW6_9GLOM|nr:hypothetical protein RhiirA1_477901 [Rhizophagus irregularis]